MVPVAVAVNVAVLVPAGIVTELETDNEPLLSDRLTIAPPLGVAEESDTVQVVDAPEAKLVGVHCRPETVGRTLIDPPDPVIFASIPLPMVPKTPLMGRESSVAVLLGDRVAVTTATTPLLIAVAFIPDATQINAPAPELQLKLFPAAVNAEPAVAVSDVTPVVG
jgi:hypothetical protein